MAHATASLRPWFTHPRMWSKWAGLLASTAIAAWAWSSWSWLAAVLGLLWFFPNEYGVHRWVYHRYAVAPDPPKLARNHIHHHLDPTDLAFIFNDPRFSVTIGVVYFGAAWGVLAAMGAGHPLGLAGAFSAGQFAGLVYYEYVHFMAHRPGARPWLPFGRALKQAHLWHHYKNEHFWFGVTNRLHDRLLGSWRRPEEVERSDTVRSLVPPDALKDFIDD